MTPNPAPRTTTLCGSLSLHPVGTGALMHRAAYAELGLDFAYVPFGVKENDLEGALRGMRALGIRGFGVSMPYKQAVLPFLDRLDGLADQIGAVNTVVNDDGHLTGYNTDAAGAVAALRECCEPTGLRVLLVGAGGAARAVAHGLISAGAHIEVANRTPAKAESLAADLSSQVGHEIRSFGLDRLAGAHEYDVLVNASSAGMEGYGEFPWAPTANQQGPVVLDIVYKPLTTALVQRCREHGLRCVSGVRMLLHQAAHQFELYTHCAAPLEVMDSALRESLARAR